MEGLKLIVKDKCPDSILVIGGGARSQGWRQMITDATGVPVTVAIEAESGCLGAAIQAMVAYGKSVGQAATFVEVVDRCVKVNAEATLVPRMELRQGYDEHACGTANACSKHIQS